MGSNSARDKVRGGGEMERNEKYQNYPLLIFLNAVLSSFSLRKGTDWENFEFNEIFYS